jgi:serine/threonine protein kinase
MEPGETFGKYVLVRRLATGGMADIYLARQSGVEGFQKPCVIKRILPQLADDQQFVSMFLDEARIAALLTHPNIVQIFDLGKQDGSYFLAMEHVHGEDLTRILDAEHQRGATALPLPMAIRIIAQVAEGLDYAHNAVDEDGQPLGIVHRDVSPPNVIVAYTGSVKIVDFGIAKAVKVKHSRTEVGVIKGKVPYMSPEQVQGLELDKRSDIFSLGALLYELTTGQKPFNGENVAQLCMQIVSNEPEYPSQLPEPLADIIMHCLRKGPHERFESAAELAQALEHLEGVATGQQMAAYMKELFPVPSRQSLPPGMKTPIEKTEAASPRAKSAPRMAFDQTVQMGSEPKPGFSTDVRKQIRDDEPTIFDPRFAGRDSLEMEAGGREALEKSLRNLGSGRGRVFAVFFVVLVLGGGAGYWWWQQHQASAAPAMMPDAAAEPAQRRPRPDAATPPDAHTSLIDAAPPRRRPEPPNKLRPLHEKAKPPEKAKPAEKDAPFPRAVPPPEPAEPKPEAHLPKDDPAP